MKMNDLPAEIMLHIAQYCPIGDMVRLLACDRALHAYMCFEPLWRNAYTRDFGNTLVHDDTQSMAEHIRALYTTLGAYATALAEQASLPSVSAVWWQYRRDLIKQCLVPLQGWLEMVYHKHGFAAAVSVAKNINGMIWSYDQRPSKCIIRLVRGELRDICAKATVADAVDRAVAIISDVTYKPVINRMAKHIAKMLRGEHKLDASRDLNRIFKTYHVRRVYSNNGPDFYSDNTLISKALNLM